MEGSYMIRVILLSVLLLCLPTWGQAATYYLNDAGSDSNRGTSTGAPWLTWAHAFANSACGDTLVVMDGTYVPKTHGNPVLTKTCTASTVFTVRFQNQRAALIAGTGAADSFQVLDSAYVVLDGLRIKSADSTSGGGSGLAIRGTVEFPNTSHHITLRNLLIYDNDRYHNTALLFLRYTKNTVIEDTELYSFHRHGVLIYYSDFNVVRRLYCHSRNRADIAGGYVSATTTQGESCVAVYPGNDNIIENVISENNLSIAESNASSLNRRNQFLGNIALGTQYGYIITARGDNATLQTQDQTIRDYVGVNVVKTGVYSRSSLNTQVFNSTSINTGGKGFVADVQTGVSGGGVYSFFCTNCLATLNNSTGFHVTSDIQTWTINYSSSFGNNDNYYPDVTANITNKISEAINPALGTCYLWLPDASPLKRAGLGGADIGATILYRYKNGALTNVPLWNPTTGEFPHGALVAGVNDVAGQSLFDVHKRLNVNTNGCSFPANYGAGGTDVNAPAAPLNLSVF